MISPAPPSFDSALRSVRVLLLVAMLGYLAFVVYGSLVPLTLRPLDMALALERFRNIPWLDLGIGSRADWVANLLLFIPLSFLMAAVSWPRRRPAQFMVGALVLMLCVALSVAIEFTQLFFPPRTVSQNDILAESLGAVLGLAAWWLWGRPVVVWVASWRRARGVTRLAEKLLWLYLFLLFGYNLLPLDLTISLVEVYHKWNQGRLNLLPFAATPLEPVRFVYEIAVDVAIWAPVALLLLLSGRVDARRALGWTIGLAVLLEFLQIFVFSRFSDLTDVITAVPGAFAGVWLAARLRPAAAHTAATRRARGSPTVWIAAAILAWSLLLVLVFWYPFDFTRDAERIRSGIDAFFQVPFVAYYFGSELRAITEVFHKIGFFVPLGVLLGWLRWSLGRRGAIKAVDGLFIGALLVPALVVELGQIALVGKHPGSTDLALEWLGAVAGYVGSVFLARRWHATEVPGPSVPGRTEPVSAAAPPIARRATGAAAYRQPGVLHPLSFAVAVSVWALILVAAGIAPARAAAILPGSLVAAANGSVLPLAWALIVAAAVVGLSLTRPAGLNRLAQSARAVPAWVAAALLVGLVAVLPLQTDAPLGEALLSGFGRPDERLYVLLKAVILWVPLGIVGAVALTGRQLRGWAVAGAAAFILVMLPAAGEILVVDLYEVVAAPLGIGLGTWLGSATLALQATLADRAGGQVTARRAAERGETDTAVATPAPADYGTLYDAAFAAAQPRTPAAVDAAIAAPEAVDTVPRPVAAPSPGEVSGTADRSPAAASTRGLHRALALLVLLPAIVWAWLFPLIGAPLAALLVLYFAAATRLPWLPLLVVPWALPALDLAPWTGRVFVDAFDLLLLVSLAVALWHWPSQAARPSWPRAVLGPAALFGLSCLGALLIGLLPLPDLDHNAFSSYRSGFNALRVAKGFAWSAVLVSVLHVFPLRAHALRTVLVGVSLGLVSVGLVTVWERWLFASLWDFSIDYRVMATFSSMHVGGAHLEAFVLTALPLAGYLLYSANRAWQTALAAVALLFGSYVLVSTVARIVLVGLAVVLLLAAAGLVSRPRLRGRVRNRSVVRGAVAAAVLVGVGAIFAIGFGGSYFQERMARVGDDLQTRLDHWGTSIDIMDDGIATSLFGMGLGRYPVSFLLRADPSEPLTTYRFDEVDGNAFLTLGAGETLYFTQRVAVEAGHRYRLTLRARAAGGRVELATTLCERHLSHSRRCAWPGVTVAGDGRWHELEVDIASGAVGHGRFPVRAPVDFGLYNATPATLVAVDDLRLVDAQGNDLLRNGDFSAGGDHWLIKTHEHLSWHIKNLWLAVYFDQGLIGVVVFTLLTLLILVSLVRGIGAGDRFAVAVLAGMGGFLAVGLVGSLFDAPRLTLLYFGLAALGMRQLAQGNGDA